MRPLQKTMTFLAVITMAVLTVASAAAEDSVTVEVRTIVASPDGDDFDDELDDIKNRLERGFTDYSSFEQLDRTSRTIERNGSERFDLPTDDTLVLGYNGRADDFVRLGLRLEGRLSTTLRATPGSTFFQAGLTYRQQMLILAITVE